jgi:hypothetical protein
MIAPSFFINHSTFKKMFKLKMILLLWVLSFSAQAELTFCQNSSPTWSDTMPKVNLTHIFCGESHRGRNKGFHSTYLLKTSPIVSSIVNKKGLGGGIYSAQVNFKAGNTKFSTFFPDHCNLATILRSVVYAATHSTGKHPQWGILGASAPKAKSQGYCLKSNGNPFDIRMGMPKKDTRVNTAFPNQF